LCILNVDNLLTYLGRTTELTGHRVQMTWLAVHDESTLDTVEWRAQTDIERSACVTGNIMTTTHTPLTRK